jgi:hypothetical protein
VSDDGAEVLAQPQRRGPLLGLAIVLGAAILLVTIVVTRNHPGSTEAAPTSTPATRTRSPQPLDQPLPVYPVPNRRAGDVARCPDGFDCPVSRGATAGTRAALEAAFPGARVLAARTVRAVVQGYGQTVWAMDVRARVGAAELRMRVQPLSPADRPEHRTTLFNGHALTHWQSTLSQVLVLIDVVAPADSPASLSAIEQLARDARLVSPG